MNLEICAVLCLATVLASFLSLLAATSLLLRLLLLASFAPKPETAAGAFAEEQRGTVRSDGIKKDAKNRNEADERDLCAAERSASATHASATVSDSNYARTAEDERDNSTSSSLSDSRVGLNEDEVEYEDEVEIAASAVDLDVETSFDLSAEVDSAFFQSGDLDVDWELESIRSVASSASLLSSLNDTDFILGGESYASSLEMEEEEDLFLHGWSSDLDSVCSSLNDTDFILGGESYFAMDELDVDDRTAECAPLDDSIAILEAIDPDDEVDDVDLLLTEDDEVVTEPQQAAALDSTEIAIYERVARAVEMGVVSTTRGSPNCGAKWNPAASTSMAAASFASTTIRSVTATASIDPEPARTILRYENSPRYLARRKASKDRIKELHSKPAPTNGSRVPWRN